MKKLFFWFLVTMIIMTISGCGTPPLALPEQGAKPVEQEPVFSTNVAVVENFSSPLAPPSPTAIPTPVSYSPTAEVIPGPLASGLKIVMIDKGEDDCSWVVWLANVKDLHRVQVTAKIPERVCYQPPGGYLSPDGRQIAYIAPGTYIDRATLGVMNLDGSAAQILDTPIFGWGTEFNLQWSPDSQWIAYLRSIPVQGQKIGGKQIWLVRPNNSERKLVSKIEPDGAVVGLLGWSTDSTQLYYMAEGNLWRANITGKEPIIEQIPLSHSIYLARLSPDTNQILYLTRATRAGTTPLSLTLRAFNLANRTESVLIEKVTPSLFDFENYQFNPIWTSNNEILYNAIAGSQHTEILAVQSDKSEAVKTVMPRENMYYYPISGSLDGQFILAARRSLSPDRKAPFYRVLIDTTGANSQEIYGINPDYHLINFVGWLDNDK